MNELSSDALHAINYIVLNSECVSWCTVAEKSAGIKEMRGEVKPTNQLYRTHLQILN